MGAAGSFAVADRLRELAASFACASEAAGGVAVDEYIVGAGRVSLRFAGPTLRERLTPAFAHLAAKPGERRGPASLTVHLWDSASGGTEPPRRPPGRGDGPSGALYEFHEPPLRGVYQPGLETLSVLDTETGVAWHWVADASERPSWDQACPIRQILSWWLRSRGQLQVHAAAVGMAGAGVLVVGRPGSGKSTVALSCLGSELLYAGDDYVAVTLEPSPRVASLYNSGKLDPPHLRSRFPHLLPLLANEDRLESEKAILYVERHFPEQTTRGFPIAAVLVTTVRAERRDPEIVPASLAGAFAALAPTTMFQLHTAGAEELSTLSSLIARVPCFALELGSDLRALPGKISDFLSTL